MAYVFTESRIGYLQIANTDAGVTMANGSMRSRRRPTLWGKWSAPLIPPTARASSSCWLALPARRWGRW